MTNDSKVEVGCRLAGEYVDEVAVPTDLCCHPGEVVRPRVVASFCDGSAKDDEIKDFTVLLHDNRVVAVRGHGLKYIQNAANPSDFGSYAIVTRAENGEVTIALFRVSEVTGIFSGEIRLSRNSA